MKRTVTKTFYNTTSWTAPAGVTEITVTPIHPVASITNDPNNAGTGSLALTPTGQLYSWGSGGAGGTGLGDTVSRSVPTAVVGGLTFSQFAYNDTCSIGLTRSGQLFGWGLNTSGQAGVGDAVNRSSPTAVVGGLTFSQFASGTLFNIGLTTAGQAYTWGSNSSGQLGLGDVVSRSSPVAVVGGLTFSQVYASNLGCFGLTPSGVAYAWGSNGVGQLGVGDIINRSSPVAVVGGLTFSKLCVTIQSTVFGQSTSGQWYGWGTNSSGQLGTGDITSKSSPVAVLNSSPFLQIYPAIATAATFGLSSTGQLFSWGSNASGQLGLGDIVNRSSPVAVVGGLTFASVGVAQSNSVLGLTTSGAVYSWGSGSFGALGVGDTLSRSSPTAVVGGLVFSQIIAGNASNWAITPSGSTYAWGSNSSGQLGVGDLVTRSSPTAVLGGLAFNTFSLAPTNFHNSAIKQISVVPGVSYNVTLNGTTSYFGDKLIAYGPMSKVLISYIQ